MAISMLPSSMLLLLLVAFRCSVADVASGHAECMNQLVGLATCLPYVHGGAKAPTPDYCTGLKEVLSKSPKCLCVLIKDRDDPQLGIKINVSLALVRPDSCKVPLRSPSAPVHQRHRSSPNHRRQCKGMQQVVQLKATHRSSEHESSGAMSSHLEREEWLRVERVGVHLFLLVLLPLVVMT